MCSDRLVMQAILEGDSNEIPFPFVVDVRNIAEAHIQAAVTPKAKGQRYLVSNADTVPASAIIEVLKERFPGLKFKDAKSEDRTPVLDNSKVIKQSLACFCCFAIFLCTKLHMLLLLHCLGRSNFVTWFDCNTLAAFAHHADVNSDSSVCVLQVQKELGVSFIPYQDTVVDMATTLIQNGIAKPQRK